MNRGWPQFTLTPVYSSVGIALIVTGNGCGHLSTIAQIDNFFSSVTSLSRGEYHESRVTSIYVNSRHTQVAFSAMTGDGCGHILPTLPQIKFDT